MASYHASSSSLRVSSRFARLRVRTMRRAIRAPTSLQRPLLDRTRKPLSRGHDSPRKPSSWFLARPCPPHNCGKTPRRPWFGPCAYGLKAADARGFRAPRGNAPRHISSDQLSPLRELNPRSRATLPHPFCTRSTAAPQARYNNQSHRPTSCRMANKSHAFRPPGAIVSVCALLGQRAE